jgi:hypothetical protein
MTYQVYLDPYHNLVDLVRTCIFLLRGYARLGMSELKRIVSQFLTPERKCFMLRLLDKKTLVDPFPYCRIRLCCFTE